MQHIVANGGNTQPSLFKNAMTSSTYLPPQYNYNERIPEVSLVVFLTALTKLCNTVAL